MCIQDDLREKKQAKEEVANFIKESLLGVKWFCNLAAFCCSKDAKCRPDVIREHVRDATTTGKDLRTLSLYHLIDMVDTKAEQAAKDGIIQAGMRKDSKILFELFKRIA